MQKGEPGSPAAWELVDLEKDPEERRNFSGDPAYAEVIPEMEAELRRLREELGVPPLEE